MKRVFTLGDNHLARGHKRLNSRSGRILVPRFTYGYGRVEDLAGIAIILTILFSAATAPYVDDAVGDGERGEF